MLAYGRLAYSEFLGNQYAANTVLNQVAFDLSREVRFRVLQPRQYQEASVAGERPQRGLDVVIGKSHIAN